MGSNCSIGYYSVIMENVQLGDGVTIGNNVVIYPNTIVGDEVSIADNSVLGKQPKPAKTSTVKIKGTLAPLSIGAGTIIGTSCVIYAGTTLGKYCMTGDLATIRENCKLGEYVLVGRGVAVENFVEIGDYTKIQTGSYITAYSSIAERVFIAPMVTTTNDNFMGRTEKRFKFICGPKILKGARIGGGAILLPGVNISAETFVAAGALVTKDTEEAKVVKGLPAKAYKEVNQDELLENA